MKYRKHYDILLVGAGLTNATIANIISERHMRSRKLSMLVIDKRDHIGGNCYTENINGIDVHKYGAHIFHTSNEDVFSFISQFGEWKPFINQPIAIYNDPSTGRHVYNMPFNMNTFVQLFPGAVTPSDVQTRINDEIKAANIGTPTNLAEQAISMVGTTIYNRLIKEYTEKQWGRKCEELPASIIKRLPVRYTFDNNYFNDKYQMIPIDNGYTEVIFQMFDEVNQHDHYDYGGNSCKHRLDFMLGTSYEDFLKIGIKADMVFYSGGIDEFYKYQFGALEYRSVKFKHKVTNKDNIQGCPVCNYTSKDVPYTRSIEHKWFNDTPKCKGSVISYEYSFKWKKGIDPYYPIGDEKNIALYDKYVQLHAQNQAAAKGKPKIIFVGRLGTYRYMDMDDCIEAASDLAYSIDLD